MGLVSQAQIENCEISNYKRSGIDINGDAKPKIKGCTITQNGKGIVAKDYASPTIENCDLRGNDCAAIDSDTSGKVRNWGNQV